MTTPDLLLAYILRRAGIPIEDAGKRVWLKPNKSSNLWRIGGQRLRKRCQECSVENIRDWVLQKVYENIKITECSGRAGVPRGTRGVASIPEPVFTEEVYTAPTCRMFG